MGVNKKNTPKLEFRSCCWRRRYVAGKGKRPTVIFSYVALNLFPDEK